MPVRVELVDEAVDDLRRYLASGNIDAFLKKLLRIEGHGTEAGQPLGRGLTTFRKVTVGNRDWRIIYQMSEDGSLATVWAIGDRADEECYQLALSRLRANPSPEADSLATMLVGIMERSKRKR
jgi:mRNA interferase RelE/StbE